MDSIPGYMRTAEAAALLDMTPQGVSFLARKSGGPFPGAIAPLGLSRGFLLPISEVEAYRQKKIAGILPKGGRPKAKPVKRLRKRLKKSAKARR